MNSLASCEPGDPAADVGHPPSRNHDVGELARHQRSPANRMESAPTRFAAWRRSPACSWLVPAHARAAGRRWLLRTRGLLRLRHILDDLQRRDGRDVSELRHARNTGHICQ